MRRPEELLAKCFVDCPDDIDLEVIAFQGGLEVRDEPLVGCEASLVGYGDKGIITVASALRSARWTRLRSPRSVKRTTTPLRS
jgi:hypothetical protein